LRDPFFRIRIDDRNGRAPPGELGGEQERGGGFSRPPLRVRKSDDRHEQSFLEVVQDTIRYRIANSYHFYLIAIW
jgi:hypothetical protein